MVRWLIVGSLLMAVVRAQASETATVLVRTRIVPRPVSVVIASPGGVLSALKARQQSVVTLSTTSSDCQIVVAAAIESSSGVTIGKQDAPAAAHELFITLHNR